MRNINGQLRMNCGVSSYVISNPLLNRGVTGTDLSSSIWILVGLMDTQLNP